MARVQEEGGLGRVRRRWKALVAVGAIALFASMFFLLPPRDDGPEWIRKYGGRESFAGTLVTPINLDGDVMRSDSYQFEFATIPKELEIEVMRKLLLVHSRSKSQLAGSLQDGSYIRLDRAAGRVHLDIPHQPPWLQVQWSLIRMRLGI
jgi:hypothetical protein